MYQVCTNDDSWLTLIYFMSFFYIKLLKPQIILVRYVEPNETLVVSK